VPYTVIKKKVEVHIIHNNIEYFYRGNRVASYRTLSAYLSSRRINLNSIVPGRHRSIHATLFRRS
jgi:hypothetical protein